MHRPEVFHVLYVNSKSELHEVSEVYVYNSAVYTQQRTLPSRTNPHPRLASGFLHGTQDPCLLAVLPPPLLCQRDL